MIALFVFALVAGATAAPQFEGFYRAPPPPFTDRMREPFNDDIFDTSKFWADISKELREIDDMLADFTRRFPTSVTQEGVEGNEYKITIPLSDFDEKDIVVKAREGLLMIQASHKFSEGRVRNYLDIRTLPTTINVNGTWTFEKSVLTIVFPLKEGVQTVESVTVVSTEFTTRSPNFDREELDENQGQVNENEDADVGLSRGDQAKATELLTNEIPDKNALLNAVEATTYAVDLRDEVEFVPVRYHN